MISTFIQIGDAEIKTEHRDCTNADDLRHNKLFIESDNTEKNTLTTITFNDYLTVYLFWESYPVAEKVDILYIPETKVLFVGAGTISFRVSVINEEFLDFNHICLFWGFSKINGYILETGELECFLYSLDGEQISCAPVDPPYEMEITEDGIRFESIVHGVTWLRYGK